MTTSASTRLRTLALTLIAAFTFTACTPDEIALWTWWMEQQPATCHDAVDRYWPDGSKGWAHRIVNRESGGDTSQKNRRSSASGCFQLIKVHAWRYEAVGYSWADRFNPTANTLAALNLYSEQGSRPWR
jgi:hypothetical protein